MRGRPLLYTSYPQEMRLFPTTTKRVAMVLFLIILLLLPLKLLPLVGFLGDSDWMILIDRALIFAVAALGLNLLTGVAGQVSLGHAFFMAVGAYTAAVLGGEPGNTVWGLELPMWIWLPAAGLVAALVGILVAPTAVRVRGLYLAFVTLGLVFIGQYLWRNLGKIAGGPTTGREWPPLELTLWKGQDPLISFTDDGTWFGFDLVKQGKAYYLLLFLVIVFAVLAKNMMRTRVGRSWASIRDRDIAAEIMGVAEAKGKTQAFAISSFYAGVAGALLASFFGRLIPETWDLLLSVEFIVIVLIGGAGTVAGTLMGTTFVVLLPRVVEDFTFWLSARAEGDTVVAFFANIIVATDAEDFGLISTSAAGPGLSIFQLNIVLFGVLIIVFLIFEPLGLYGIWIRIRNYWKAWPFSY
jgi:branched-chain amino acid transport system permease protein